jgi:hypothetical protein
MTGTGLRASISECVGHDSGADVFNIPSRFKQLRRFGFRRMPAHWTWSVPLALRS